MDEGEISQDMTEVDIRIEKMYPFTIQTMNAEGWRYFRDLALVSLAVSGITFFLITGGFETSQTHDLASLLITALVSCVVNVVLFVPRRVAKGKRCEHCQSRMLDIETAVYCDYCEEKYGFSEAAKEARKVVKRNLSEWYSSRAS